MNHLSPCACGSTDITHWEPEEPSMDNCMGLDSPEKIQCKVCGRAVWCGDAEGVDDWNNGRYDNDPTS